MGKVKLATACDWLGTIEPLLIPKHQRRIPGFEENVIALFAKGLSTRDIKEILKDLYGEEVSATLISESMAAIDVRTWRSRSVHLLRICNVSDWSFTSCFTVKRRASLRESRSKRVKMVF